MKTINIKTIRIDGGTQSRVEINQGIVAEYAEAIKTGAEFPAVVVFNDGVDNWLADGFHRFHAHNQAEKTSISVDVRQGTARDAILFSLGANGSHGLRRTNADKRKAVMTLLQDFDWSEMSSNAMAKTCGVSHTFVDSVRSSILQPLQDSAPETRKVERNGTVYEQKISNIGRSAREENIARGGNGVISKFHEELSDHGMTEADLHGGFDPLEAYEAEVKTNKELNERIEAMTSDDSAKKINELLTRIYGLEGRIQQLMASEKAMDDTLKYHSDVIHKLRKIYGVETHKEIIAAAQRQAA